MKKHFFTARHFSVLLLVLMIISLGTSCITRPDYGDLDFRLEMRNFVKGIAQYARTEDANCNPDFIVIPQNGQNVAWDQEQDEFFVAGNLAGNLADSNQAHSKVTPTLHEDYFSYINGTGREDTFYGGGKVDYTATPEDDSLYFTSMCDIYKTRNGADGKPITVLSIDYCRKDLAADSLSRNNAKGYVSIQETSRGLDVIPSTPMNDENNRDINRLSDCSNFLYLLNPNAADFPDKETFISKVCGTNYDAMVIDLFFNEEMLTKEDVDRLKIKANGKRRLVICYMSIGESEDYRWYWNDVKKKSFVLKENSNWKGNYITEYWNSEWQEVIYGSKDSYTGKILSSGFDGVYLDIVDCFENFE